MHQQVLTKAKGAKIREQAFRILMSALLSEWLVFLPHKLALHAAAELKSVFGTVSAERRSQHNWTMTVTFHTSKKPRPPGGAPPILDSNPPIV